MQDIETSMWDGRGKGDRPQGEMLNMRRGELINGASGGRGQVQDGFKSLSAEKGHLNTYGQKVLRINKDIDIQGGQRRPAQRSFYKLWEWIFFASRGDKSILWGCSDQILHAQSPCARTLILVGMTVTPLNETQSQGKSVGTA